MKIDIDFELLKTTGMSPDDYTYLYIIHRKGFNYLDILTLRPNLTALQHNGYVELGETFESHVITPKFKELFSSNFEQMFAELVHTYPWKVESNRGIRILHAKDPNARANDKSRNRYQKIVGTKLYKHKHIMDCLEKQLAVDKENLGFLQNLEVWINNHTWEKYENLDENDTKTNERPRITRSL